MTTDSSTIKLVLLGHKNVGKTSIFNRYVYDDFGKTTMTIGAYFAQKQCRVQDKTCNLAIWDTAGEEKFDSLTSFYVRNARAALVCYDITNSASFVGLARWVEKIAMEADEGCALIIVGNKLDLADKGARQVDFAMAKQYGKSVGAEVIEASAASGKNVVEIFEKVVTLCLERQQAKAPSKSLSTKQTKLRDPNEKKKPCCS